MNATEEQITELASAIEDQAHALATGSVVGPRFAAVIRLRGNVETLAAWMGDDR